MGPLEGIPVYGGLDLSAVSDLTALVLEASPSYRDERYPEAIDRSKAYEACAPTDPRGLLIRARAHASLGERSLADYLHENGVLGLHGLDTRSLVRRIRSEGAMRAGVS